MERSDRICQLCHLWEVEIEEHFIFCSSIYYEIQGQFHCLFRETQTLQFLQVPWPEMLGLKHAGGLSSPDFALLASCHTWDLLPLRGWPPFSWCSHLLGVPSDRLVATLHSTPDQCGLRGSSLLQWDPSGIISLDPIPTVRRDHPGPNDEPPFLGSNIAQSPEPLLALSSDNPLSWTFSIRPWMLGEIVPTNYDMFVSFVCHPLDPSIL